MHSWCAEHISVYILYIYTYLCIHVSLSFTKCLYNVKKYIYNTKISLKNSQLLYNYNNLYFFKTTDTRTVLYTSLTHILNKHLRVT